MHSNVPYRTVITLIRVSEIGYLGGSDHEAGAGRGVEEPIPTSNNSAMEHRIGWSMTHPNIVRPFVLPERSKRKVTPAFASNTVKLILNLMRHTSIYKTLSDLDPL